MLCHRTSVRANNRDDDDDLVSISRFQSRASVVQDKKFSVSVGGGKLQSADHQCGTEPLELANRENHTCSFAESRNATGENPTVG